MSTTWYMTAGLCSPDVFGENNSIYLTSGLSPMDADDSMALSSLKLAQIFYVYGQFIPTKASIYLKTVGDGYSDYFDVSATVSIDALNFSHIVQSGHKFMPYTLYDDYTGKASLYLKNITSGSGYPKVYYPVKTSSPGTYTLWVRSRSSTGNFVADVYVDDVLAGTINQAAVPALAWSWFSTNFTLQDQNKHIISLRLRETETAIDKLCIASSVIVPASINEYQSSFITVHLQVYTVNADDVPQTQLDIYDSKSTATEIQADDWYNFDLNFLDSSESITFDNKYALVVFSVGGNSTRYVVWEFVETLDPYICGPSAIKF